MPVVPVPTRVGVEADGKIVAVGSGNGAFAVVRYLPNGTPDSSFGKAGVVLTTVGDAGSMPAALAVQGDGKLVTAGLTYFLVPTPTPMARTSVRFQSRWWGW